MSPLELLAPEAVDVVPFSVRLAKRRLAQRAAAAQADRREHLRRRANDLEWLTAVRLTGGTGYDVRLVDLSEGGALLEVDAPLRPGVTLTLEMTGPEVEAAVPLEVLRCYVVSLRGGSAKYRGACAFAHVIELPGQTPRQAPCATANAPGVLMPAASGPAEAAFAAVAPQPRYPDTLIVPATGRSPSTFQKIVARQSDGKILKGYTQDFHPSRAQFSLWPSITATPKERTVVAIARLKAVFFVRDFDGNPNYQESKVFDGRGHGRRIEVTFSDGEAIRGTTLNYRPDGQGFMVIPADPGANNTRIFVVATALRRVRFL